MSEKNVTDHDKLYTILSNMVLSIIEDKSIYSN